MISINKLKLLKTKVNIFLKNKFTTLKLLSLGSSIPINQSLAWDLYSFYSRFLFNKKFHNKKIFKEFRKNGYVDIGYINYDELEQIKEILAKKLNKKVHMQDLKHEKNDQLSLLVFQFLKRFSKELSSVIGSEYQTLRIDATKTMPSKITNKDSSFAWHFDDEPKNLTKLFLYLDNTNRENGAFRILKKKFSYKLYTLGFISNSSRDRVRAQSLMTKEFISHSEWIERDAGALFCFDNCMIHKATYPLKNSRTILAINLCPSTKPLTLKNVQGSFETPRVEHCDYPNYPWLNNYLGN